MIALAVGALAFTAPSEVGVKPLMKLRGGGLPSAALTQKSLGYLVLTQALVGQVWTKESMEMYEFTSPVEDSTTVFAKFNYALQIAHGLFLTGLADPVTAIAVSIYFSASTLAGLKAPKLPAVAWAGTLLAMKKYTDAGSLPAWAISAVMIASGLHGTFMHCRIC